MTRLHMTRVPMPVPATDALRRPSYGRTTFHQAPRPRRRTPLWLIAAVLAVALVGATVQVGHQLIRDFDRSYLSTEGWPIQGQGAYQIGDQQPAASLDQRPSPIASLAKVMTAYLVLERLPLSDGDEGPLIDVTEQDVADTDLRRARDESIVALSADADLSERDALMALLLPSANNVAVLLARTVAGSIEAFVQDMNDTAQALGMRDTTYTDPSGFDDGTVSTATDQLTLAEVAAADPTMARMMATPVYWIPFAGEIRNTDSLLGVDGFVGMKTGSHDAAGGCFMFRAQRDVNGYRVDIIGVVLGQHSDAGLIDAALASARELVDRVAPRGAR